MNPVQETDAYVRIRPEEEGDSMTQVTETIEFDTTDVDRHIGKPVGGGQL